jgi:hypothetical protein
VSPLHLMDIKRVAFETRPVKSKRPAITTHPVSVTTQPATTPAPARQPAVAGKKINREEIAAIVDRFLAGRRPEEIQASLTPAAEPEAGSMYMGTSQAPASEPPANGGAAEKSGGSPVAKAQSANGHKAVDFVSEDDVRRALQKGEKIYIHGRTIITPAARDMGEPAEVFAKV